MNITKKTKQISWIKKYWKIATSLLFLVLNIYLAVNHYPSLLIPIAISFALFLLIIIGEGFTKTRQDNLKLSVITIFILLSIVEIIFFATGFMSTWMERNVSWKYTSNWEIQGENSWYHIWTPNTDANVEHPEFYYPKSVNSEGIIGEEFSIEKDSNEFRIIILGDSFTEGVGAPVDSSAPVLLEKILKDSIGNHIKILNAGVSGSDIIYCMPLLRDRLLKYRPDLVIAMTNNTDFKADIPIKGGVERFQKDTTVVFNKAPWSEPIYATSRLSRLFFQFAGFNENLQKESYKSNQNRIQYSLEKANEAIDEYHRFLDPLNIPIVVIYHPLIYEIKNTKDKPYQPYLNDGFDLENKTIAIDIYPTLEEHQLITVKNCHQYYWPIDLHHNSEGYHRLAQAIAIALQEHQLIPKE